VKKDGPNVDIETYSFLTTTPNPQVSTINHERMPVLLTREQEFQTWLTGTPDEALALTREYPPIRNEHLNSSTDSTFGGLPHAGARDVAVADSGHPAGSPSDTVGGEGHDRSRSVNGNQAESRPYPFEAALGTLGIQDSGTPPSSSSRSRSSRSMLMSNTTPSVR
jgi:hypothetical protein